MTSEQDTNVYRYVCVVVNGKTKNVDVTDYSYTKQDLERYGNGKIYKLVSDVDDKIFIGSCCLPLHKMLYNHKSKASVHPSHNVNKHFNAIGWDNVRIILIEKFPCKDKDELKQREQYYIDELKPELNKYTKEKIREKSREWSHNNKDKTKAYYEANKEKINLNQSIRKSYNWHCDICNCDMIVGSKSAHLKTIKHQSNMNNKT